MGLKTRIAFAFFCVLAAAHTYGNSTEKDEWLLSFEKEAVPAFITATDSLLATSTAHYKDGKQSLEWTFEPNGVLQLKKDLKFEKQDPSGKDLYLSAFIVWIYNEKARDTAIRFEFLKDGRICTSFPFYINFTGWRAAWVCYERDMQGIAEEGMDALRIVAPDSKGRLFIDHLITATKLDSRYQTPDLQVPFVNAETSNHWLMLYKHSFLKPDIKLTPISKNQKKDMQILEKRLREQMFEVATPSAKEIETIRNKYNFYGITYTNGSVSGVPIFMVRAAEAYERLIPDWDKNMFKKTGTEMRDYFDLMKRIAVAYNNSQNNREIREEMKHKFLAMYDHITDQGVAYGSCWGTVHHYGYSLRSLYPAYFLMKEVLREAGKLQEAEKTLIWYAITNEIYPKPEANGINMDSFNTQAPGRIASILIMEDTPEKLQYLKSFSRWIDYGCRPAAGLSGSFKIDGAAFHHCNNYPAYAVGGLEGATNMLYVLQRTEFAVSEEAHQTVKNALLAMRFYCNTKSFPLALSGRHPNGKGKLVPWHYALAAISGTPDGRSPIDAQMAGAYLRLVLQTGKTGKKNNFRPATSAREQRLADMLIKNGFTPEEEPQGNISLGYGCISVQRRANWAAVVRGHSRYLWAAEHYVGANRYGRYFAHGSLQILTGPQNQDVTPATSGWQQEGFDWNRIPGVTSIHLPLEQLQANVLNVDTFSGMEEMLYSDESFAGGLCQQEANGNFGMKLHEHDKYNGSHRARKSFHFMGSMIVCLGSGIENTNTEFPTETTIFQLAVTNEKALEYWNNYQHQEKIWIDHVGTGYYVPDSARFEKNFPQFSRMQNNGKLTSGDWVSLSLNHGKAPQNMKYEYALLPQTSESQMRRFAEQPAYTVLQHDRTAHIVRFEQEKTTSYVMFETPQTALQGTLLQYTDSPCLAMIRQEKDGNLLLTVAQPDLGLYSGPSDEIFDKDGKRIERSIYSRPWIYNESREIPVTVTLKGRWSVKKTPFCRTVKRTKQQTVLQFLCKDGASFETELKK